MVSNLNLAFGVLLDNQTPLQYIEKHQGIHA